ncbi:p-loop containing nucleoside triphosphate hydrolase [Venustampulla echinocandica]|uniref:RNA helicase n=1 Tax=Venustampulla echinocandica TaxID=2656787 RepID=A0A370TPE3_9HELO|nr:p-loop containing nucleoside triphosphate hydrolase [Venustampulla echinocandica]RDL37393.1 p-loop containing nucleoside triphosphate hydrolase [Venustampulla echinocandica]
MLRPKTATCLFCSFNAARHQPALLQWPAPKTASFSTKPVSRPSRMSLAPARKVNTPEQSPAEGARPNRRKQDGPFGGMNLKEANIRGVPERVSPSYGKRGSRPGRKDDPRAGGFKALKMQRALAPVSYGQRTKIKERIREIDSFDHFPLLDSVKSAISTQALPGMEGVVPTPVQKIAIPALLGSEATGRRSKSKAVEEKKEFLIAAETGSGKTLAYLTPTIHAVKKAEMEDEEIQEYNRRLEEEKAAPSLAPSVSEMPHPTTGRPRAIILVPTAELVAQVGNLVKAFSHTVKFRSAMISSAFSGQVIRNRLFSPRGIDVLVTTPHLLSSIADSDPNILSRVTHLVVDEADSLLDRGFSPLSSNIIDRATPSLQQLILCSATIPRSLDNYLRNRFPDIRRLVTPNLHAIPRRVQLGVVDVEREPYRGNKNLACADTIWTVGKAAAEHDGPVKGEMDVKRILVFVNERDTTQEVADYLVTKGIDAIALNRDTPEQRQTEMLASFTLSTPLTAPKEAAHPGSLSDNQPNYLPFGQSAPPVKRRLPNTKVLVTTDLGSRGIDTLAVRHVILYDVPHSTIDFIHRLGRTGRMGRRGRGIVLVGKHDRRDVVAEVRDGMYKGQALI